MSVKELVEPAFSRDLTKPGALKDAFEVVKALRGEDEALAIKLNKRINQIAGKAARENGSAKMYDLYNLSLIFGAPYDFDYFMLALERNRPAQERFWLPRRAKLMPVCRSLQAMEEGQLDELFLSLPPRVGKALADDTPILTRDGWKNHGDLAVGDEVIGLDGKFKKVIAVHPKCQLDVMVEFTNGERIQCHENHEWLLYDRGCGEERLRETKEYERQKLDSGTSGKRGHRYRFQLPKREYIVGEEKELPLDPYVLGVWLGDGANKAPRISNPKQDEAIIDRIVAKGYPIRWKTQHKTTGVWYYSFDIRKQLRAMGMCHSRKRTEKHIPDAYLTASIEQRLELLAGLLDTDGTYTRKEKRYHYSTCDERLRDGFIQLISTFGWRANVTEYAPKVSSSGIVGRRTVYVIGFCPDREIPCELERKRNREFAVHRAVSLKSIERVEPKQGNCITVEGDGMYLAGHTMVPTHNTTLMMFFFMWVMGRNSERSNLYCSYTDSVVKVLYNGILEVLNDAHTYAYKDIFPAKNVASTDAKDLLINLDRKKRYASFTGRSLYGTLNGACDCNGYLVGDDLISGIEEAMSPDRLSAAWAKVDNNMLPRAKESAKVLWIGTRWSLTDPQGRRMDLLTNDPRYKERRWRALNTPALDENDESNFTYRFGVGFSSEYYKQRRASFERNNDMASWYAQYQGEPIERNGQLFEPDGMRYFNGVLPDEAPDRVFMAIDPAWGGGDFCAAVVVYQYGTDLYVPDVIFDNGDKRVTQPEIVGAIKRHNVSAVKVEGTKMTASYGEDIDAELRKQGIRVNMQINTSHFTGTGKRQRIFDQSPEIKERMIFLSDGKRPKRYSLFMQNLFSFTVTGKEAKHDDAPDVCAMAIQFAFFGMSKAEVIASPFH